MYPAISLSCDTAQHFSAPTMSGTSSYHRGSHHPFCCQQAFGSPAVPFYLQLPGGSVNFSFELLFYRNFAEVPLGIYTTEDKITINGGYRRSSCVGNTMQRRPLITSSSIVSYFSNLLTDHYLCFTYIVVLKPPMNRILKFDCTFRHQGCSRRFRSQKGRTYHIRTIHTNNNNITPPPSPHPEPLEVSSPESSHGHPNLDIPNPDMDPIIRQSLSPSPSNPTRPEKEYHPWLTGAFVFR